MSVNARSQNSLKGVLTVRLRKVSDLDREIVEAMWDIFDDYYADIDRSRFESDLKNKDQVFLLFDQFDGSLQGFSTIKVFKESINGKEFVAIYSGDTIINESYWGQTALQRSFFNFIIKTKMKNLGVPVYWFLISKGYKTYLLLSRNFPNYWPRHDAATPEYESEILNQLSLKMFGDNWLPEEGVLRFNEPMGKLKQGVAPISQSMLEHKDIAFFLAKNAKHTNGDELCCLGKIDSDVAINYPLKLTKKLAQKIAGSVELPWPA